MKDLSIGRHARKVSMTFKGLMFWDGIYIYFVKQYQLAVPTSIEKLFDICIHSVKPSCGILGKGTFSK